MSARDPVMYIVSTKLRGFPAKAFIHGSCVDIVSDHFGIKVTLWFRDSSWRWHEIISWDRDPTNTVPCTNEDLVEAARLAMMAQFEAIVNDDCVTPGFS